MPALETPRLWLPAWRHGDTDLLIRLSADPRVMHSIGSGEPWSIDEARAVSARVVDHWRAHGFGWRVAIDKPPWRAVGLFMLSYAGPGTAGLSPEEIEIGWWLAPDVWGRGLATEGARLICDEAFERVGAPSVIARVQPDNLASARVAARLGMSPEDDTTGRAGEALRVHRLLKAAWSTSVGKPQRHPSLDDRFDPAVRIVDPDPGWAVEAEREQQGLQAALGSVAARVEHVGSTAVPGLAAKPILDLQVAVTAMEPRERYVGALQGLGYLFAPDSDSSDLHFFAKPAQRPRSHHVHVCEAGSDHEFRHLALRDFLRAHSDEAAAYAALKHAVVRRCRHDRLAYIEGKHAYIVALEARALKWAGRDSGSGRAS